MSVTITITNALAEETAENIRSEFEGGTYLSDEDSINELIARLNLYKTLVYPRPVTTKRVYKKKTSKK